VHHSEVKWLGEVPDHWEVVPLKRAFAKVKRTTTDDAGIVTAFRDGQVTLRSNRRKDGYTEADDYSGYQGIAPGDLAIHSMDAFAGAIGVSDSQGMCSPVLSVCTAQGENDPRYMAYQLRLMSARGWIEALSRSVRERTSEFRWAEAGNQKIALPPVQEQRAIAAFLDREVGAIDNLLEKQNHLIETLAVRRKALLREVFSGKLGLTLTGSEISWKTMRLGLVAKNIEVKSSSVTAVSLEHIQSHTGTLIGEPELTEAVAGTEFREGDVLFGKLRPYLGKAYAAEFAGVAVGDIHVYRTSHLLPSFLKYWLISPTTLELINSSTYGTKMPRANWDQIKMLEVKFPPVESQKLIVDYFNSYLKRELLVSAKAVAASRLLSERRAALIAAAVTGKVDVRGKR
jgi:type I restriction enzyme, S subunit